MSFLDELRQNTRSKAEQEDAKRREIEKIAQAALFWAKKDCMKAAHSGNHHADFMMHWERHHTVHWESFDRSEVELVATKLKQLLQSDGLQDVSFNIETISNPVQCSTYYRANFVVKW